MAKIVSERPKLEFLANWGPSVLPEAGDMMLPDFDAQCQAMLATAPKVISSTMGLYPPSFIGELKARGILWFATATTAVEARLAEDAGADVIVAQGMEAGGHRGAFDADQADRQMIGLLALIPQIVDAVSVPVVATGGIADARGVAAALILGSQRCPNWNRSAAQPGSHGTSRLYGKTGADRSPRDRRHPRIHRPAGPRYRECVHARHARRSSCSAPSRPERTHYGDAKLGSKAGATSSACKCGPDKPPN